MLQPNNHINYTAADIQQYLQGNMTPAQMHQLEKAALYNTFLAEAIEGFEQYNDQQTFDALAELKANFAKNNHTPVVSIKPATKKWWRIAAAIFGISTTVALTYFVSNKNKIDNTQIANNNNAKISSTTVLDSTASQQQQVQANTTNTQQQYADVAIEKKTNTVLQDKLADTNTFVYKPALPNQTKDQLRYDIATTEASTDFKAIQEKSIAAAPATVFSNNALNNATITNDIIVNNQQQNGEAAKNETAVVTDELTKIRAVKPVDKNDDKKEMQEVVVVGYGVKRNVKQSNASIAKIDSAALAGKVSGVQVLNTNTVAKKTATVLYNAQPAIGWDAYNMYLKNNNQLNAADKITYKNKKVVLHFVVKQSGKLVQIKLVESVCPACDEEAIRLLKNGSKWLPTAGKKSMGTITLSL